MNPKVALQAPCVKALQVDTKAVFHIFFYRGMGDLAFLTSLGIPYVVVKDIKSFADVLHGYERLDI